MKLNSSIEELLAIGEGAKPEPGAEPKDLKRVTASRATAAHQEA